MDKKIVLDTFNNTFADFLVNLLIVFPNNAYMKKSKTNLKIITGVAPRAVIGVWEKHINNKYYNNILKGEIEYFLEKDFHEDLQILGNDKSSEILDFIDKIRTPVKNLDSENLQTCLQYLQNLSKLSYAYNNM